MRLFRLLILLLLHIILINKLFAQPSHLFFNKNKEKPNYGWKSNKEVGLYFNQVSFTNWNAGGSNSISAIFNGIASANYKTEKLFWNSNFNLKFGVNKQESEPLRKTEDAISIISNFGYEKRKNSNWFYSARFSLNTQLAEGFNDPENPPISRFMAPGYLFLGAGFEYGRRIEKLSFYASPLTLKATFVLDQNLADAGSFGVNPAIFDLEGNIVREGENVRSEFGALITNQYQHEIMENIKVNSLARLYLDYLNNFGNIDIEWELNFDFKINKYINAILGSHIRYDDDIKVEVSRNEVTNEIIVIEGPKLQWKQLLGIGFVLDLDEFTKEKETYQ